MKNISKISPDDPRLTAFALGELEGEDLAAVEAALRDDPAARAAVAEIQAAASQLEAALGAEPMVPAAKPDSYGKKGKLLSFPQFYYVVGGLAAAVFAVLVAYREQPPAMPLGKFAEKKSYVMVNMPTVTAESAAKNEVDRGRVDAMAAGQAVADQKQDAPALRSVAASQNGVVMVLPAAPSLAPDRFVHNTDSEARRQTQSDQLRLAMAGKDKETQKAKTGSRPEPSPTSMAAIGGNLNQVQRMPLTSEAKSAEFLAETNAQSPTELVLYAGGAGRVVDRPYRKNPAPPAGAMGGLQPNTESYAYQHDNEFLGAAENPLSTFSVDVDTASYANVRRFLSEGRLPPADAVRVEELVNYFPYHYAPPRTADDNKAAPRAPFAASLEVADAPWAPGHRLVRIGLKGREVSMAARGAANLVFLLDVSGSMDEANKLPLVKESMRLLIGKLRPDDRVAIVVYAGASGLALPSTPVAKSREILEALDALAPGGSTNGAMGIQLAYDIAKANFVAGGLNRVILCTDGDFNVGVTSEGELARLIGEKAKSGVFLTVLGFGMGNYKDATLEKLADKGNGNYGYIDTRREAEKLLVAQVNGTLLTIAQDVKLQVEFNPAQVASYRLIGYEDRLLKKEDFNNDAVDAGEIGAGHTVTALYEIVPAALPPVRGDGSGGMDVPAVDPLKYQEARGQKSEVSSDRAAENRNSRDLLTLKVRYKEPAEAVSRKLEFPLADGGARFADASADFKLAAAVAEFGMILRDSPHKGSGTLAAVRAWAEAGTDGDNGGYRSEFVLLVRQAEALLR
jgi:Ca-activated chloride channel homolog